LIKVELIFYLLLDYSQPKNFESVYSTISD
jgi:hypothetical protein